MTEERADFVLSRTVDKHVSDKYYDGWKDYANPFLAGHKVLVRSRDLYNQHLLALAQARRDVGKMFKAVLRQPTKQP